MKSTTRPLMLTAAGFSGIFAATALAADQTWNSGGPSDNWNTTDLNWDAGASWTNGNTAIFSGSGEALTAGTVNAAGMTFSGTDYILNSGTITHSGVITTNESATINSNIALSGLQSWSAAAGKSLTLGGVISGSSTLTYGGSGSYSIGALNTHSGSVIVDASTVTVGSGKTLIGHNNGFNSNATVTVQNGGVLEATDFGQGANTLFGQVRDNTNTLTLGNAATSGTFRMLGTTTSNINRGITVAAGGGKIEVASGQAFSWTGGSFSRGITLNGVLTVGDAVNNGNFTTDRVLSGSGGLTKSGSGTLTLQATNTFSGTLTVNGGIVEAAKTTTSGTASAIGGGSTSVVVNAGGTLLISGNRGTGYHNGAATINGGKITMNGDDLSFVNSNTMTFATAPGTIDGSGMWRRRDANNKVAVTAAASGSTISVATLNLLDNNPVFEVANGANAADLTISSAITGSSNLRKEGAGTLVLSGASTTYAGTTQVNAGTLLVNGTLNGTSVTVAANGTLGGSGTIGSHVTISGALSPGNSPGTLTLSNTNLTFDSAATALFELGGTTRGNTASNYDSVVGINTLTLEGIWTVLLYSGFTPSLGNSFDLFDATTVNASGFTVGTDLLLPSLSGGLGWDSSNFIATGQIVVIPEPRAALLGGLGLLALLRRRR